MEKKVLQDIVNVSDRQLLETIESLKNLKIFTDIDQQIQNHGSNSMEPSASAEHGAQIDSLYFENFKDLKDENSNDQGSLQIASPSGEIMQDSNSAQAPGRQSNTQQISSQQNQHNQSSQQQVNKIEREQFIGQGALIITDRISQAQNLEQATHIMAQSLKEYTDEYDKQGYQKLAMDSTTRKIILSLNQDNKILKKAVNIFNGRMTDNERQKHLMQQELRNKEHQIMKMKETINQLTSIIHGTCRQNMGNQDNFFDPPDIFEAN
ncbi:UNKNOWN [Stylonychia lemnae]|uniref:Uncharacterized protein n=1 Tax=Stylonychia lemnae TaxID=5949 RepID=A0A078AH55_STYLE|nr:UNKNOWN [Stylonychia lemnae]|eukprot:CDW81574.1 UNKNOWN [Stylonychia lemnae]